MQCWHAEWPVWLANVLTGQGWHVDIEVAPVSAEHVPAGQRMQAVDPVPHHVPAAQIRHVVLLVVATDDDQLPASHD